MEHLVRKHSSIRTPEYENKRKHNSHEWFFASHARELRSKYAFATDCGTLCDSAPLAPAPLAPACASCWVTRGRPARQYS